MGSFLRSVNHLEHLLQYFNDNNPVKENQFLYSVHACRTKQGWNQGWIGWLANPPPSLISFKVAYYSFQKRKITFLKL